MKAKDALFTFTFEIIILSIAHAAVSEILFPSGSYSFLHFRTLLSIYIPIRLALAFSAYVRRAFDTRPDPPSHSDLDALMTSHLTTSHHRGEGERSESSSSPA